LPQIETQVSQSLKSTHLKIDPKRSLPFSYELFGYDFMVEDTGKAVLIEVNSNPTLETANDPIM
jgi:hypothetical protein